MAPLEQMSGVCISSRPAVRSARPYQREVANTTCTPAATAARSASALTSGSFSEESSSVPSRSSAISLKGGMRQG